MNTKAERVAKLKDLAKKMRGRLEVVEARIALAEAEAKNAPKEPTRSFGAREGAARGKFRPRAKKSSGKTRSPKRR